MKLPYELKLMIYNYLNFQECIKVSYTYSLKVYNHDIHTFEWCIKNDLKHVMEFFIFIKKPIEHSKRYMRWCIDDIKNKTNDLYKNYINKYKNDLLLSKFINYCIIHDNLNLLDKIYKIQKPNISCSYYDSDIKYIKWAHENLKECCKMSYFTQAINQHKLDVIKYMFEKHPDKFKIIDSDYLIKILLDDGILEFLIKQNVVFCSKKIYMTNGIEDIVYEENKEFF